MAARLCCPAELTGANCADGHAAGVASCRRRAAAMRATAATATVGPVLGTCCRWGMWELMGVATTGRGALGTRHHRAA